MTKTEIIKELNNFEKKFENGDQDWSDVDMLLTSIRSFLNNVCNCS